LETQIRQRKTMPEGYPGIAAKQTRCLSSYEDAPFMGQRGRVALQESYIKTSEAEDLERKKDTRYFVKNEQRKRLWHEEKVFGCLHWGGGGG